MAVAIYEVHFLLLLVLLQERLRLGRLVLLLGWSRRTQQRPRLAAGLDAESATDAVSVPGEGGTETASGAIGGVLSSTRASMMPMLMCNSSVSLVFGFMKMRHVMVLW